ncbi:MAG: flavodoxin family protein [Clostridiales bacterium]|nr:flavodoxin family protein [Clostridiales bacterium]
MKALVLQGSPRANKSTDILSDMLTKKMKSKIKDLKVTKIYLREKNISPCNACGFCEIKKGCSIKDEMAEIYEHIETADIIILASPLYFGNVSAYAKSVIDRCQMYWSSKYVLKDPIIDPKKKRIGIAIACGGNSYKRQFDGLKMTCDIFFKSINTKFIHDIFVDNTDRINIQDREEIKDLIGKIMTDVLKELEEEIIDNSNL